MPYRIQLRRTKGWRMPANSKRVDRSTQWGNPFHTHNDGYPMNRGIAVAAFQRQLKLHGAYTTPYGLTTVGMIRAQLQGKNLACWCPLPAEG